METLLLLEITTEIKRIKREYYEQLYSNILNSLGKWTYSSNKNYQSAQEEIDNLNKPITTNKIKLLI